MKINERLSDEDVNSFRDNLPEEGSDEFNSLWEDGWLAYDEIDNSDLNRPDGKGVQIPNRMKARVLSNDERKSRSPWLYEKNLNRVFDKILKEDWNKDNSIHYLEQAAECLSKAVTFYQSAHHTVPSVDCNLLKKMEQDLYAASQDVRVNAP